MGLPSHLQSSLILPTLSWEKIKLLRGGCGYVEGTAWSGLLGKFRRHWGICSWLEHWGAWNRKRDDEVPSHLSQNIRHMSGSAEHCAEVFIQGNFIFLCKNKPSGRGRPSQGHTHPPSELLLSDVCLSGENKLQGQNPYCECIDLALYFATWLFS